MAFVRPPQLAASFIPELILKGYAFGVVFLEPFCGSIRGGEDLKVLGVANLLARVHVNKDGHCVSLSDESGLSEKRSSVLSMSLGLNSASPVSARINKTVPVTTSHCG